MPFRKHSITLCERRTKKKTRSWFDWAQLIIAFSVPVAITVYTIFQTKNEAIIAEQNRIQDLSISEKNRLSDIALSQDDQREAILVEYLNSVGKLLDKYGMTLNDTAARLVARYKTLAALEQLDPKRRSLVIRSLYELGLIKSHLPNGEPLLSLKTADLTALNLSTTRKSLVDWKTYEFVDFTETVLINASFRNLRIKNCLFKAAHLEASDFSSTSIVGTNFQNYSNYITFELASLAKATFIKAY
ncbi:unnamed protein product, partial [Rotaria sp. Silwood1]